MFKKIFFYLFPFAFVMSCASKKDVYYFQDIDNSVLENSFKFLNIQPGDILDIQIKALNPESVLVFQRQATLVNNQQLQTQSRTIDGYLVGEEGTINLPIVGNINTSNENTHTLACIRGLFLTSAIGPQSIHFYQSRLGFCDYF